MNPSVRRLSSDESPLRGGGGAAARKLRQSNLSSQSEPDLNAARRRRKRGSKKVTIFSDLSTMPNTRARAHHSLTRWLTRCLVLMFL